ncbi:MAG: HAMP domain-containing histidine kinase [Lentisphaerae bacterium]|nr:HAMP domain-containing histidine kinase [Lentisphaerota bacterium]
MKKLHLNLNLTGLIVILAVGVLLPVMLSTAAGIVALVIAKDSGGIVTGVLVISFAATAAGSGLVAVVLMSRKAVLARRQSDFLANVSHEFRTPLSAIRLYAQTLQSGKLGGDAEGTARCIATILRETERLDAMMEGILTWRASSRDMMPLKMEAHAVEGAVCEALDRFRAMVPPDDMDLCSSINTGLEVLHDRRAISSAVLNLLTNAHKYTPGEKRIEVTAGDTENGVVIQVRDNGVGMSPHEAKRIFQPFYRAEASGNRTAGGIGLGLAIARHTVALHGGEISVSSEKGKGSVFTITLPSLPGNKVDAR